MAKGDTLAVVAKAQGVTVDDLQHWNHLDDVNRIEIGDELFVTPGCATEVMAPVAAARDTGGGDGGWICLLAAIGVGTTLFAGALRKG